MFQEPQWRQDGDEPDYRFTMANERTFLAWIRTALAVLAGGVLLEQFATRLQPKMLVSVIAVLMCILAGAICLQAYFRWRANEIAMRHKRPLPSSMALIVLSFGMFAVVGLLIGLLLWASH